MDSEAHKIGQVGIGVAKMERDAAHHENARNLSTDLQIELDDPHRSAVEFNPEQAEKVTWSTLMAVLFLALSYVCPISCGFILVTGILNPIGIDLGDTTSISWIVGGWSIASSVSFSLAGAVSDVFGRRWTVVAGEVFAVVGSVVACTARTTLTVVAGSTLIGFGCGIIFVSYAGISELLPNKWRGTGIGFTETVLTIPWSGAGVLIATLLDSRTAAGWRWCSYIGIIYGVISLIGTLIFYFPPSRPQHDYDKTRLQEFMELDFVGISLYTGGLVVFLLGLSWAGTPLHPWRSASVIAPIVIGLLTLVACFAHDWKIAKQPLFPPSLLCQVRDFTVLLVVVFVAGMVYYSMSGLLPQGSLFMFTNDPIEIGIMYLPNGMAQVLFGGIATLFMGKIGHLKLQVIVCLTLQTLFVALYSVAIPRSKAAWMAFQFFGNGPFALLTLVCYVIAGLNVPLRHLGLASGLIGTFRSAGGSVGNAIFNTILNGIVATELPKRVAATGLQTGLDPTEIPQLIPATLNDLVGIPGSFATVAGITPAIQAAVAQAARDAYVYAFRRVFWASIPFGIIAIVCACLIRDPSQYLTNHTAVHMENRGILGRRNFEDASHAPRNRSVVDDEKAS